MFSTKVTVSNVSQDQQDFWSAAGRTLGGPLVEAALRAQHKVVNVIVNRRQPTGTFIVVVESELLFDDLEVKFGKRVLDPTTGNNPYTVFAYRLKVEVA